MEGMAVPPRAGSPAPGEQAPRGEGPTGSPEAREAGDPRLLPAAVGGAPGESFTHT